MPVRSMVYRTKRLMTTKTAMQSPSRKRESKLQSQQRVDKKYKGNIVAFNGNVVPSKGECAETTETKQELAKGTTLPTASGLFFFLSNSSLGVLAVGAGLSVKEGGTLTIGNITMIGQTIASESGMIFYNSKRIIRLEFFRRGGWTHGVQCNALLAPTKPPDPGHTLQVVQITHYQIDRFCREECLHCILFSRVCGCKQGSFSRVGAQD